MRPSTLQVAVMTALLLACGEGQSSWTPAPEAPSEPADERHEAPAGTTAPPPAPDSVDGAASEAPSPATRGPREAVRTGSQNGTDTQPVPVGPGIAPPLLIEPSASLADLRKLLASGDYTWGVCVFTLTISETGEVRAVDFLKPENPAPEVASAVVSAASQWRFHPATKNGEAVAVEYHISVNHCPLHRKSPEDE